MTELLFSSEASVYFTIFGVGLVLLIVTAVLGDLFEFEVDAFDFDGPSPFSSRIVFAGAVGFGAGGWVGNYLEWGSFWSFVAAMVGFASVAVPVYALVVIGFRQESNSTDDPGNYVGLIGMVVATIPENGIGLIGFKSPASGAHTVKSAIVIGGQRLAIGEGVVITESNGAVLKVRSMKPAPDQEEESGLR